MLWWAFACVLWALTAQRCDGGDHNIFVTVVDAGGNPIDGVRVREIFTGDIKVTGAQAKDRAGPNGTSTAAAAAWCEIVDENNNPLSPQTPGMSADWPQST